ncbi:MAG: ABC transporter ATP-binding protein [Halobacteriota archaeon]|nr:ABC transporter ATP-binding protein [Halobacteriota archaeon]
MIKTEDLTKEYNGNKAVNDLNLIVKKGDVFGFLGPNGAGKTTTILMLTGMIEPTGGSCYINRMDVTKNPLEVKRITGYLPEGVGFYNHLTASQNLDFFARFYEMNEEDRKRRIDELLPLVGLQGVQQKVGGYSRGMVQRLGIAQALLNDPDVIFLDEPTSNLDPEGVFQLRQTIKKLSDDGKTIFFSSHILSEVSQVCKTVGIISKGKLVEHGTLDQIKKKMDVKKTVKIIVETTERMPKIEHEDIIDAEYKNKRAIIEAKSDIREFISKFILEKKKVIIELRMEEASLEDVFMDSIYQSGGER